MRLDSKDFKHPGRRPSGEPEERILIRDRGRIPEPVPAKAGRQRPRNLKGDEYNAPVAQLDRALPSEGKGQGFESLRARQFLATWPVRVSIG